MTTGAEKIADYVVPFKFPKEKLNELTKKYMTSGSYTKDDIAYKATLKLEELVFIPFYKISGTFTSEWSASFGFDRKEPYTHHINSESATAKLSGVSGPVTRYKTVTDWKIISGMYSGTFYEVAYVGRTNHTELVDGFGNEISKNAVLFDNRIIDGARIESFDKTPEYALDSIKPKIDMLIEQGIKKQAKGDRQKDWSWTFSLDKKVEKILVPVAHTVFEYEGKEYNLWINGSNNNKFYGDALPVDKSKRLDARLSFLPFIISVVLAMVVDDYFVTHHENYFQVIAILLTLIYGVARWYSLVSYSRKIRDDGSNPDARIQLQLPTGRHFELDVPYPLQKIVRANNNLWQTYSSPSTKKKHFILLILISAILIVGSEFYYYTQMDANQNSYEQLP